MSKKITVTYYIPSMGNSYFAASRFPDIEHKYFLSYDYFKEKESNFINYSRIEIDYKRDGVYEPTDIQVSIPPCKGLSSSGFNRATGKATASADSKHNNYIYEAVQWCMDHNNKVLIFENAKDLYENMGKKVLANIAEMIKPAGYKMNVIKSTGLHHNLAQNRVRTFVIIYKSNTFKLLKNIVNPRILAEQFFRRPEAEDESIQHVEVDGSRSTQWRRFLKDKNFYARIHEIVDNDKVKRMMPHLIEEYKRDNTLFDGFPRLKGRMDFALKKMALGKGYYDVSPVMTKDFTKAINPKNGARTIHPKYHRFITLREMMDLMGFPDDYRVITEWKDCTRTCPTDMMYDLFRWARSIVLNDGELYEDVDFDGPFIRQNNIKMNLYNETNYTKPEIKVKQELY